MDRRNWIASIALLGAIDWYADRTGRGTLSQAARTTFRTDTKFGKIAWTGTWVVLSAWLVPHILKHPEEITSST